VLTKLTIAAFLLAHAGIHTGFVSPRPSAAAGGPAWPFDLTGSWLLTRLGVDGEIPRLLAITLIAATIGGYALAALAAAGVAPNVVWGPALLTGSLASIALLGVFFHPWLVVGFAIDAVLLWSVLVAGWSPDRLTP
jgi:hypothetical protein